MSVTVELPRTRVARLHGEAACRIILRALGSYRTGAAEAMRNAMVASVAEAMPAEMVTMLSILSDEEIILKARDAIEPDIRARLAMDGRLPS